MRARDENRTGWLDLYAPTAVSKRADIQTRGPVETLNVVRRSIRVENEEC